MELRNFYNNILKYFEIVQLHHISYGITKFMPIKTKFPLLLSTFFKFIPDVIFQKIHLYGLN